MEYRLGSFFTLNVTSMHDLLKTGDEVSFPGISDFRLTVTEVHEWKGDVRCKYYDDHLMKYIELTLPADALIRCQKPATPHNNPTA